MMVTNSNIAKSRSQQTTKVLEIAKCTFARYRTMCHFKITSLNNFCEDVCCQDIWWLGFGQNQTILLFNVLLMYIQLI